MTAAWVAEVVRALSATPTRQSIGAVLARCLPEGLGADGVVVWLPQAEADRPLYSTVFVGGGLTCTDDLVEALGDQRLPRWLSARGMGCVWTSGQPSQAVVVTLAWQHAVQVAEDRAATLELLVAYVSRMLQTSPAPADGPVSVPAAPDPQRGVLSSGLVHDFNNCLTTILGFTEMAMGHVQPGEPVHEHLVTIRTVALDAAVVIKRLQALKRGTKLAPDRSPVDLAAVATTMREISRPRWERSADHPGPAMTVNVRALDVPTVLVIPAEVRELLLNLIFNAIDAMPSGGTLTITTKTGQDGWAEVLVEDTGIGMSAEVLGRIFEPFFSTKGAKGSGLGLSVSRTIAQRYGGTLTATSMVGVGTTFTLRLPPAPASSGVGTESVQASAPVAVRTPVAAVARPQGRRVLLVDDQVEVLMVVSRMLRSLGHDVVTAGDGPAALSAATQGAVDLVLTDYHMPGMNGGEVASRLQRVAPTVPVVIFSGSNLSSTPLPSNVQRALGKPLTMDTLGEVVGACANAGVHA